MTAIEAPSVDPVTPTAEQQVAEFLSSTTLFRGPDPDIIRNHRILPAPPPRSAHWGATSIR